MTDSAVRSLVQIPGVLLLVQLVVILVVTRGCGWLLTRLGQPRVVGEIAGGILLGPLALGYLLPGSFALLFPSGRLHPLEVVSNVGLVLFLFVIGSELDLNEVRQNRRATLAITLGSIGLPFAFGVGLSPLLLVRFGMPQISRVGFTLFVGIAMSITALPVLARILEDRKRVGRAIDSATAANALICAAANDLLAWFLLAVTLTLLHGSNGVLPIFLRLATLTGYIAAMLFLVRPLANSLVDRRRNSPLWLWLAVMVGLAFLSAHVTDSLGIHAFFGAFLAGICVPRSSWGATTFSEALRRPLQWVIDFTLPVFFVMTGLRMQRDMFDRSGLGWLAIVLVAAVVGKIGGAMLAARAGGMRWEPSIRIGILLNTRGLVELIVLNVGYKEGILSPLLFTVFVLMAILTTAMTVPLLALSERMVAASARS
jgi:Kef-type K+ transport system membrane component KefB